MGEPVKTDWMDSTVSVPMDTLEYSVNSDRTSVLREVVDQIKELCV